MSELSLSEWWALVSGKPHHGWRRLAHSVVVPAVLVVALVVLAERVFA